MAEREEVALEAWQYVSKHLAQSLVQRALRHNASTATAHSYKTGAKLLVWREKQIENRIGEWVGSYTVMSYDAQAKLVFVQASADVQHERYNLVQIKTFSEPAAVSA